MVKMKNGEYTRIVDENHIKSNAINFLSETFINKNQITEKNIADYIDFLDAEGEYTIIDVKKENLNKCNQFITYGFLSKNGKFFKYRYYIITIDIENGIFSIDPTTNSVKNLDEVKVEEKKLKANYNNKVPVTSANGESICEYYFNNFKNILQMDYSNCYKIFNAEYAQKKFSNEDECIEYLKKNKKYIEGLQLNSYKINVEDDKNVEYLLVDQYENIYTINAINALDYTLILDTYTILTEKFKAEYAGANKQNKVMMNIDKWIQMLNNRDYTAAYKVLDETFRNNNFGSEENFEKYMREQYPLHYKIEFLSNSEEANTYIQKVRLKDITGQNKEQKEINIIMQLKEGTDFVMSFGIE